MWSALGSLLTTVGLSVAAWFLTHFAARHVLRFYQLREKIREELFFTGNVSRTVMQPKELIEPQQALRRLAAQLASLNDAAPSLPRRVIRWLGYDLEKATTALTGISNSIMQEDTFYMPLQRAEFRSSLERALALPRSISDADIEELRAATRKRAKREAGGVG